MAHPQIAAFARLAKENAAPTRLLYGQKTLLSRTMHDIRYDAVNDEIFVTNPFAQAIMVFRGGANGEEAPIRIIQGSKTQMDGPDRLDIDTVHNEIFVPEGNRILVYPRNGNGNVAPLRVIVDPDPKSRTVTTVAVDPVHNLIIAGTNTGYQRGGSGGALLVFNRTDNGKVKPKALIQGPKTAIIRINQLQVYSPKGWIIAAQPGRSDEQEPEGVYVGVWHVSDNGDVPPRWKIAGPKSLMKKPRGIVLDPKHKELIVADMRLNSVLTYSFPEIF